MKCRVCGTEMKDTITDLPFKLGDSSIVIVKGLPVRQCSGCREYLLDDPVMERVEEILAGADNGAELEVIKYAA